jgi:hypothetical protein
MDGAVNPVSIAISISTGTSLLAGFLSLWVAMRSLKGAGVNRDTAVSILFCIAFLLMVVNAITAALFAVWGMAYFELVKAALLLTAAFAVVGMVFGLVRGLRTGRSVKTRSA